MTDPRSVTVSDAAEYAAIKIRNAEQRGPGRPEIGPPVNVRLPADLLAWLDEQAADAGVKRAEFIRDALEFARTLEYPRIDQ
jgi:hypothetical protein